ncbi:related to UDP-N-acetyl-D-mannosamine 6-dehydrogenase [Ramularia collo-cygni]|uniref:Related to UDP-N-acetyl-D-mannosamine 6-dehydrogenase n=1 Tax=Ramularia collo-cygni TaxID=112498 RepID=A0A2D3V4P8_9PEZI|nr:related to UDP-N-acetyl-D-mannosamine 6-dehydrogenase [Ramularia collo-cygni]CZT22963.1 related to UDP-N-acetyl-D-mannosamine 6-dehydrogenase [Ramularia collo-cygni]
MASLTSRTVVELQAPRKKSLSWVPLEAPDSPPLTPPEIVVTRPEQAQYFDQRIFAPSPTPGSPTVAVIGTGYVGLHLVEAFSTAYDVIAFDVSEKRVQEIKNTVASNVTCVSDPSRLTDATHFLISVSTILNQSQRSIDISCIKKAIETITKYARPGSTVIIESSVAVGMTRELLEPLMHSKSLLCGMSPERVDPGRVSPTYETIPKIISGLNEESLQSISDLYSRVFQNIVPVSKPEVAEMTKLYENCQRMMCIAYVNEMADACRTLSETLSHKSTTNVDINIDPWEVANAAGTKPFGYQPYTPSLGVGGHCIPVNPYYLLSNAEFPLLEACAKRMEDRPARIGDRIMSTLSSKTNSRPSILIVGLGFKRGQSVLSHSPGKALAVHLLATYDVYVEFADPLVEQSAVSFVPRFDDASWSAETLERFDAIVVAVDQPGYDYDVLDQVQRSGTTHVEWFCRR